MEYLDAFRPLHSDDVAPSLLADLVWPWPALVAGATALSLADGHRPSPGAPGHAIDETPGADRPPQPGAGTAGTGCRRTGAPALCQLRECRLRHIRNRDGLVLVQSPHAPLDADR